MKTHLTYLLLLTMLTIGFAQKDNGIDLGGESVITSIIPVKRDTALDFRVRWLGLRYGDLCVDYGLTYGGYSDPNAIRPYNEVLEVYEYVLDQAHFYEYLMKGAFAIFLPEVNSSTKVLDTLVQFDGWPIIQGSLLKSVRVPPPPQRSIFIPIEKSHEIDSLYGSNVVVDTIAVEGIIKGFVLPDPSLAIVVEDSLYIDSVYWHKYQHVLALSDLLKRCIAKEEDHSWGIYFNFESDYRWGSMVLRGMAYEMYRLLDNKLSQLSDSMPIEQDTITYPYDRCIQVSPERYYNSEKGLEICEKDIMAYAKMLQTQMLGEDIKAKLDNLTPEIEKTFTSIVAEFDEIAEQYEQLRPNMSEDEQRLLDSITTHTNRFNATYRAVLSELKNFQSFSIGETSYWHLIQIAEYLRILEATASMDWGVVEANSLVNQLKDQYIKEVWELQEAFLARKEGN